MVSRNGSGGFARKSVCSNKKRGVAAPCWLMCAVLVALFVVAVCVIAGRVGMFAFGAVFSRRLNRRCFGMTVCVCCEVFARGGRRVSVFVFCAGFSSRFGGLIAVVRFCRNFCGRCVFSGCVSVCTFRDVFGRGGSEFCFVCRSFSGGCFCYGFGDLIAVVRVCRCVAGFCFAQGFDFCGKRRQQFGGGLFKAGDAFGFEFDVQLRPVDAGVGDLL